ncbi:MAG: YbaB/EbfC family nucleoid-associated protein [Acidobacteriota bacterium]|nr:YbaB/EbfC family nucleoid-associated protein [Acidobacteriota bacterium]
MKIEPDAAGSGDLEMLQDLVVAAFNEAARKVDEAMAGQIGGLTGGMRIPGLM